MDCVWRFSTYEAHQSSRYVFAALAIAVLGGVWRLQAQRQPYAMRGQHFFEAFLYAVDIMTIILACVYGALTNDGAVQDGSMRVGLELGLGALILVSVVGAVLFVLFNMARELRYIQQWYLTHGLVQVLEGTVKARQIIDAPIEAALRDGAVRLIDVAWLLDSARSDGQLPRVTKVVAHLASNEPRSVLIRRLATHCGTSSICITVEAASAASLPPSPSQSSTALARWWSSARVAPEFAPSAPPSSHPITLKVTFHLSTFDEAAPLTAASLQGKAEAVKKKMIELKAKDVEIVTGMPFLPRCQDMPPDAFLSPKCAADLFAELRRGVRVGSYCWRMPGMPDPDGRTLEKMRGFLNVNRGRSGNSGLFVDVACLPQNFAWPSWYAPEAISLRFGENVSQGPLTVLKFELERVATEDEAQVCVDSLVSLIEENKWAPASVADFKSLGLGSHDRDVSVLFHGRYRRGMYCFDEGVVYGGGFFQWIRAIWRWIWRWIWRGVTVPTAIVCAEGYMRFRTEGDAKAARQNLELKRICGGKEPILMGEHIFENELKFKRGLSVMGSLYASATGTCVLQLTDPPGELGKEVAPDELVSEHTGTVFVVRTDMSLEELREELGDGVLACEKKARGEVVVRVLGERSARAARSLDERGYPLHRKDRKVYPMYNLRPYGSRGWPTFETSAASIVLAHLTQVQQRFQRGEELSDKLKQLLASLEGSGPKLFNIDLMGNPREVAVAHSPVHFLRECKKKLRSKRIFFTGKADRNDVVQLLSDFEDSIAIEFDQKRARRLKLLTEDLKHAVARALSTEELSTEELEHAAKLGEARRARSRMLV